jgi:hypothetical protein
MIDRCLYFLS